MFTLYSHGVIATFVSMIFIRNRTCNNYFTCQWLTLYDFAANNNSDRLLYEKGHYKIKSILSIRLGRDKDQLLFHYSSTVS